MMSKILVLNGPNLNLLGTREPHHYGATTLDQILVDLNKMSEQMGVSLDHFQSNAEHDPVIHPPSTPKFPGCHQA